MTTPFKSGTATIEPLVNDWILAAQSGKLLTLKHDPNGLQAIHTEERTIVTPAVSSSLVGFLNSGSCRIDHYFDRRYPSGAGYYAVTPISGSLPAVVGSGVPAYSTTPSGSKDTLIVVSGSIQGWHVHAEETSQIAQKIQQGRLRLLASYER